MKRVHHLIHTKLWCLHCMSIRKTSVPLLYIKIKNGGTKNAGWLIKVYLFIFVYYTWENYSSWLGSGIVSFFQWCISLCFTCCSVYCFLKQINHLNSLNDTGNALSQILNKTSYDSFESSFFRLYAEVYNTGKRCSHEHHYRILPNYGHYFQLIYSLKIQMLILIKHPHFFQLIYVKKDAYSK